MKFEKNNTYHYIEVISENEDDLRLISKMFFKTYGYKTIKEFQDDLRNTKMNKYKRIVIYEKHDKQDYQKIKYLMRKEKLKKVFDGKL